MMKFQQILYQFYLRICSLILPIKNTKQSLNNLKKIIACVYAVPPTDLKKRFVKTLEQMLYSHIRLGFIISIFLIIFCFANTWVKSITSYRCPTKLSPSQTQVLKVKPQRKGHFLCLSYYAPWVGVQSLFSNPRTLVQPKNLDSPWLSGL